MRLCVDRTSQGRTMRLILKHEPVRPRRKEGKEGEEKEPRYPPGFFAQRRRGHVCIIRDKPITARNACQAVKRYPGPCSQVD